MYPACAEDETIATHDFVSHLRAEECIAVVWQGEGMVHNAQLSLTGDVMATV